MSSERSHATVLTVTVNTLIDQLLLSGQDYSGSSSIDAISTLRVDVYEDQLGKPFGTFEHLRDYRLRPLDTAVPDIHWKDYVAVNDLIGEITSDREDTLINRIADRIAAHYGLSSIGVKFIGNGLYRFRYNDSEHMVGVGVDNLTDRLHAVALIEDTDANNINDTNVISQEPLWTPYNATSGDKFGSIEAHLDSQHLYSFAILNSTLGSTYFVIGQKTNYLR